MDITERRQTDVCRLHWEDSTRGAAKRLCRRRSGAARKWRHEMVAQLGILGRRGRFSFFLPRPRLA